MKWRVLISAPYMIPVIERFHALFESAEMEIVIAKVEERLSEEKLLEIIKEVDGVICGDDQFTEKVLRQAKCLKVISKWGTGIDSIDIRAAAKLGIRVCNTPNVFTNPVADTALGYILCFARKILQMHKDVKLGNWLKPPLVSLSESTLGLVGVGNIGQAVARRAKAFGMTILGTDPAQISKSFIEETSLNMVPLSNLLTESDFVSLHCDLNSTSFHMIGEAELQMMRSSAYLINTSRGAVIDEPSLIKGLQRKWIAGAALDVFEVEPLPAASPLMKLDNCLLAPHNSNGSPAAWEKVHLATIENLLQELRKFAP